MNQNTIKVIVNKPIEFVFTTTINPKYTHLWIDFIDEEITDKFPPELWTIYRNRRWNHWNISTVTIYEKNKTFKLENDTFSVQYNYKMITKDSTELTYIETIKHWELTNPFTVEILNKLKELIESE